MLAFNGSFVSPVCGDTNRGGWKNHTKTKGTAKMTET